MVVKKRFRSTFILVAFYALAGTATYYFLSEAQNGNRGSETNKALQAQIDRLSADLAALQAEKAVYDHRNALLSISSLDPDLLDERARGILNRVHAHDVVILDPQ